MSEEEWLRCNETNKMFVAMDTPSEEQLSKFNLACCRRIRKLLSDKASLNAIEALEVSSNGTIAVEIALDANRIVTHYPHDPSWNGEAAMAIGHAVCRSTPKGDFYFCSDAVDNARLVALKCQWAVAWAADPDSDLDDEDPEGTRDDEPGLSWLREKARQAEAAAQCELIRQMFGRRAD